MLVVEPLLTYRFGRVQESMHKAVSKGLRITVGYALILFIVGCLREWLALGSVFGVQLSALSCLWHPCRQAASSCWAWCVPSGARWPANTRNT